MVETPPSPKPKKTHKADSKSQKRVGPSRHHHRHPHQSKPNKSKEDSVQSESSEKVRTPNHSKNIERSEEVDDSQHLKSKEMHICVSHTSSMKREKSGRSHSKSNDNLKEERVNSHEKAIPHHPKSVERSENKAESPQPKSTMLESEVPKSPKMQETRAPDPESVYVPTGRIEITDIKVEASLEPPIQALSRPNRPSDSSCRSRTVSWLLFVFIAAVLFWVGLWTVLAAHTEVARDKIYPALETKYFQDRAGARVFTYLLLFYIAAGMVSLTCLARNVRLPSPAPFLVRSIRMPDHEYWTILELGFLCVFVLVQLTTIITRVETKFYDDWMPVWDAAKVWYEVTKMLGKAAAITVVFLLLPISKSCFWLDLFNLKFERSVKFHRWLAWFLVAVVVAHAATAIASLAIAGQFKACMWPSESCVNPALAWGTYGSLETSRKITYGWISGILGTPLFITSLPWVRRHHFEWFYYVHFLFVPSFILWHLHYQHMIYYAAPSLAAYVLDKVLWWYSSRRPVKIINLTMPAPGFVRMEIAIEPDQTFEPGQWIQINIPAVSFLEWHPMSVASAPGHSTITIDIKVVGAWTRRLQELSARFNRSKPAHTCVFLDQFHGSSHRQMQGYLNHQAVLMFGGGIGITPLFSALRTIVEDSTSCPAVRRVVLVWCVSKVSVLDLYREELARIQTMECTPSGCQVDVIVHATLSKKEDECDFRAVNIESADAVTITKARNCPEPSPFRKFLKDIGTSSFSPSALVEVTFLVFSWPTLPPTNAIGSKSMLLFCSWF